MSCPIPFPKGLPTIDLPRVSLAKLLGHDEKELDKIFDICLSTGFFYLNLQDCPEGKQLWDQAVEVCGVGKATLPVLDMQTKQSYKAREGGVAYDFGYFCPNVKDGVPKFSEAFHVPFYELFMDKQSGFQLPPWLKDHNDLFASLFAHGYEILHVMLRALETRLQLEPGALRSLHRREDPSYDFLRVLRYPPGDDPEVARFIPHRDVVSATMLFTWVGGLQILKPDSTMGRNPTAGDYDEADWRWVEPVDGHCIVNIGDALAYLTNEVLRSGFHRVLPPPGDQATLEKFSVLLGYRPAHTAPMKPFTSPLISQRSQEQPSGPVKTAKEWGLVRVTKIYDELEARGF
ncbi:hypothetical protein CTA1_7840 [Colletotrichum tanaceti]|uniref:Fe2OG dioxygenase domain-containing protein n=1 Tax=Colletotrichum tanaceti TaxID=1306861 RepID=A0A4U6XUG8_9PEZI|nr:hypothetical protein CTA1_7840 [Colletotrichum tanaceti]